MSKLTIALQKFLLCVVFIYPLAAQPKTSSDINDPRILLLRNQLDVLRIQWRIPAQPLLYRSHKSFTILGSFNPNIWKLTFYGGYLQPIALFKEDYQPDLRKVYQNNKNIKPLPFPIGYAYRAKQSNLMLAIKKKT
jgi:hypothetical protein